MCRGDHQSSAQCGGLAHQPAEQWCAHSLGRLPKIVHMARGMLQKQPVGMKASSHGLPAVQSGMSLLQNVEGIGHCQPIMIGSAAVSNCVLAYSENDVCSQGAT